MTFSIYWYTAINAHSVFANNVIISFKSMHIPIAKGKEIWHTGLSNATTMAKMFFLYHIF